MSNTDVDLLPSIRCKCGKTVGHYYESMREYVNNGGTAKSFFQANGIKRLCCMMELQSPAVIPTGGQYYNIELIEGRISLDEAKTAAVAREIGGSIESSAMKPVYKETFYPNMISDPGIKKGNMIGGGYVGDIPEDVGYGSVISGIYSEPVKFTGKYRTITGPQGVTYQVPVLRPTLRTQPVKSTYDFEGAFEPKPSAKVTRVGANNSKRIGFSGATCPRN